MSKKNKENISGHSGIGIFIGFFAIIIVISILVSNSNSSRSSNFLSSNSYTSEAVIATIEGELQAVEIDVVPESYTPIIVQKGIPVKFNLKASASSLTGCNNEITIGKYGITKSLEIGDNIVEFTPAETGTFEYTCYMGMISSSITVVEDINNIDSNIQNTINESQKSGSCGCGS